MSALRLLVPVSWLYGAAVWTRNRWYDAGLAGTGRAGVPVISVGNLTAGGTGKTPFVEYLVHYLQAAHKKVAVLSRGYKRTTKGTIVVSDGAEIRASADEGGDEPCQIARRFPEAVVISDERRTRSARIAAGTYRCDVILLDDGFQHRALGRDLDIVMVDGGKPLSRMPMLPAGLRREPLSSLRRAGLLVVSRAAESAAGAAGANDVKALAGGRIPVVTVQFIPDRVVQISGGEARSPESIRGAAVTAFCGIGNPEGFRRTLGGMGLNVLAFEAFPDHYRFTPGDMHRLRDEFERSGASMILTTEKDAVRLSSGPAADSLDGLPLHYITIKTEVVEGRDLLEAALDSVIRRKSA